MKYYCPICNDILSESATKGLFSCVTNNIFVPELKVHIDSNHIILLISNFKEVYKLIEVPPYTFQFTKGTTVIFKNELFNSSIGKTVAQKQILTLNSIIDLPWYNKEQVFEKINLYLTME